jgi:hypothetical protein
LPGTAVRLWLCLLLRTAIFTKSPDVIIANKEAADQMRQ